MTTINWQQVVNVVALGFVLGFGSAAGVLSFCMVSGHAVTITRWLRQRALALNRWSKREARNL